MLHLPSPPALHAAVQNMIYNEKKRAESQFRKKGGKDTSEDLLIVIGKTEQCADMAKLIDNDYNGNGGDGMVMMFTSNCDKNAVENDQYRLCWLRHHRVCHEKIHLEILRDSV